MQMDLAPSLIAVSLHMFRIVYDGSYASHRAYLTTRTAGYEDQASRQGWLQIQGLQTWQDVVRNGFCVPQKVLASP